MTGTQWTFPASFGQERLWLASELEPVSTAYNLALPVRLPAAASAEDLVECLRAVVARHEVLRTSLRVVDGRIEQVVHDQVPVEISGTDRPALDLAHSDDPREADDLIYAARTPIALDQAPLWRASAQALSSGGWLLFFLAHHTIFDGASYPLLVAELTELSAARAEGRAPVLAPVDVQYGDYSVWLRGLLAGQRLDEDLGYWQGQLSGAPVAHGVPTDRRRPPIADSDGAEIVFDLPAELESAVASLAGRLRSTPTMVYLAGWVGLLSRMSGERDLTIGIPFAGRPNAQTQTLLGMFVNTLPLRFRLPDDPTLTELITLARTQILDGTEHQLTPFQKLVEHLAPPRDGSLHPLYQLGFNHLPGTPLNTGFGTTRDELGLELTTGAARIEYRTGLYDPSTVRALAGRFLRLLGPLVVDPSRRLSQVDWLAEQERDEVLRTWNATDDPAVGIAGGDVLARIAAQVAATPDGAAVLDAELTLTYAELADRADALARALRDLGVGTESVVAVHLDRSVELMVALLGVLRSGAAYLPLDPGYPPDRLAFMAADAGVAAVLTAEDPTVEFDLPAGCAVLPVVGLTAGRDLTAGPGPDPLPDPVCSGEQAAYVIYTSGSTGRPKGVVNTHAALANRLDWMQREYQLGTDDVVLQKTPASFDVSVWEFFWPLMTGARLVMAEPGGHQDPIYLCRTVIEHQVTTMHFVPSMLTAFLTAPRVDRATSLRRVICSGEELPAPLVARFADALPHTELHNLYGPTEAAIDVTAWQCAPLAEGSASAEDRIPIGRPITNVSCYVLDPFGAPVPPGVVGELCLAGAGLARGYLGRPGLTADRFVPDPFAEPGARMYRTGDRARWRADGVLDFLGRADGQIKLRGQRIELGELESVLRAHPRVDAAVAQVVEPRPADQRLIAHLVTSGSDPDVAGIRDWLVERLPDALVPQHLVELDRMPLTPSGKVDRRALPPFEDDPGEADQSVPRTEMEAAVTEVVRRVLGRPEVGVDEDFFAMGGHSLLAAQVISRIAADLGVEVPIHEFFAAPTAAALAAAVEDRRGDGVNPDLRVPRRAGGGAAVLSFAQERVWFMEQYAPGTAAYCVPVGVSLRGDLEVGVLDRAVGVVLGRHESLRMSFPAGADGAPSVVVGAVPVGGVGLCREVVGSESVAWEVARECAGEPFEVGSGPLVRWRLLGWSGAGDVGGEVSEHLLVVVAHHIVTDGWSSDLLVGELVTAYGALRVGAEPELPELPVDYLDYSAWQRDRLSRSSTGEHLHYWQDALTGLESLDLPTDRPRPARQVYQGATVDVVVPEDVRAALVRVGREQGATLYMTLCAAYAWLLAAYSGQREFAIGCPVAGRTSPDLEPLIGMFVNTLAIPVRLADGAAFADLLAETRSNVLGALEHQELPFEHLVGHLGVARDVSRSPIVQTLLVVQNFELRDHSAQVTRSGLDVGWQPVESGATRFDLECQVVEIADQLRTTFTYNSVLFDHATVAELADRWLAVLTRVSALPGGTLDQLGIPLAAHTVGVDPGDPDAEPEPDSDEAAHDDPDRPLRDSEALVAGVWTQVLGLARVTPVDDFFDLGGHSLLATQVSTRLAGLLDVDIPVALLFSQPTLAAYSAAVEDLLLADLDELSDADAELLLSRPSELGASDPDTDRDADRDADRDTDRDTDRAATSPDAPSASATRRN